MADSNTVYGVSGASGKLGRSVLDFLLGEYHVPAARIVAITRDPSKLAAYAARGVQSEAELDKSLARLLPYQQLKGIDAAVDLLLEALDQRQRIVIVGDFDADGATASTVGVLGLRLLGAAHVDYLVPNRFKYGYGLTPEIVEVALQGEPQLLITVDNGISSVEGVAAAKAAGLKVLVTDAVGNPQEGVMVNADAPASGASAVLSSAIESGISIRAVTGSDGIAEIGATANDIAGCYKVTATLPGSASKAVFNLRNWSGAQMADFGARGVIPYLLLQDSIFCDGFE